MTPRFIQLHPRTKNKLVTMKREAAAGGAHRVATRIHAVLLNDDKNTYNCMICLILPLLNFLLFLQHSQYYDFLYYLIEF